MLTDDGLRVARLEGRITNGAEGADGHGNIGVTEDVVAEGVVLPGLVEHTGKSILRKYRILLNGILFEPSA